MAENKILEVKDLCCSYQKSVGLFGKRRPGRYFSM